MLTAAARLSRSSTPPRQTILTRSPTTNRAASWCVVGLRIEQLRWRTWIRFGVMLLIAPLTCTTSGFAPNEAPGPASVLATAKATTVRGRRLWAVRSLLAAGVSAT